MQNISRTVKAHVTLTGSECRAAFRNLVKNHEALDLLPDNVNVNHFKNIVQILRRAGFIVNVNRFQKTVTITNYEGSQLNKSKELISWLAEYVHEVGYLIWKTSDGVTSQIITQGDVIMYDFDATERKEKLSIKHLELKTSGSKSSAARDKFLETMTALKREGKEINWNVRRTEPADFYTDVEADLDVVSMVRLRNSINPRNS